MYVASDGNIYWFFFILCDGSTCERALYISGERPQAGRRCLAWVAYVFLFRLCLVMVFLDVFLGDVLVASFYK